ncbi:MAG: hypothetical protein V4525_08800 [Pseudomonadota bacterium]
MSQKKTVRKKKHTSGNLPNRKMHLVEVATLLGPIEVFIQQLKQGEIWINEEGEALLDLPGERVEELVRKGQAPRLALPNLMIITEIYFQVVAYCFSSESMKKALNQVQQFRSEILDSLKTEKLIEHHYIKNAECLIKDMQATFLKAPRDKVARVINEIMDVAESTELMIEMDEVRAWLQKELPEVLPIGTC